LSIGAANGPGSPADQAGHQQLTTAQGAFGFTTTDQILPPVMPGFQDQDVYPLNGPDLAVAQALATASEQVPATAVLYAQDTPPGHQWAQTVEDDLAAIGIDVQPQFFPPQTALRPTQDTRRAVGSRHARLGRRLR
jgi:ABC-type transport system substrate-binding protein